MPLSELTGRRFPTTAWSVVLAAGRDSTNSQAALARLCEAYWYPVYAYIRHRGYTSQDTEDLTQQFFAYLLQTHLVQAARPDRGRFRSFLLASVRNFLANEWDRAHAGKRGGTAAALSLDFVAAEGRYAAELSSQLTPERLFERGWALALLERVLMRLRSEFETAGRTRRFELMESFLDSEPSSRRLWQARMRLRTRSATCWPRSNGKISSHSSPPTDISAAASLLLQMAKPAAVGPAPLAGRSESSRFLPPCI